MHDSRRYPGRPLVGAGAVVHRDDKVLLIKRAYPPNAGKWAIPGGLVELGESAKAAAEREVKEETGLTVKIEGLLDVGTDIHRDDKGEIEYHFILVDYVARPAGGGLRMSAESKDCGWFSKEKIADLEMPDGTRKVIESYYDASAASRRYPRRSLRTRSIQK